MRGLSQGTDVPIRTSRKSLNSPRVWEVSMNLRKIQKLLVLWPDAKPSNSPFAFLDK